MTSATVNGHSYKDGGTFAPADGVTPEMRTSFNLNSIYLPPETCSSSSSVNSGPVPTVRLGEDASTSFVTVRVVITRAPISVRSKGATTIDRDGPRRCDGHHRFAVLQNTAFRCRIATHGPI